MTLKDHQYQIWEKQFDDIKSELECVKKSLYDYIEDEAKKLHNAMLNNAIYNTHPYIVMNEVEPPIAFSDLNSILNNKEFQTSINSEDYSEAIHLVCRGTNSNNLILKVKALLNRCFNYILDEDYYKDCIKLFNSFFTYYIPGDQETMLIDIGVNEKCHVRLTQTLRGEFGIILKYYSSTFENFLNWNSFLKFLCDVKPDIFIKDEMKMFEVVK